MIEFESDAAEAFLRKISKDFKVVKDALSAKYELQEEDSGAIYIGTSAKANVLLVFDCSFILHAYIVPNPGYELSRMVGQTWTISLDSQYHTANQVAAAALAEVDRLKTIAEEEGLIVEEAEDPGY